MATTYKYYVIYKPFRVLSQFTTEEGKKTLADFFEFDKDVYPVGRLDFDSEGLLILTNDNYLKNNLLNPANLHNRTYLVQVEGEAGEQNLELMRKGVLINIDGKPYKTLACSTKILETEPILPERFPPIRVRKSIPTSWIEITIGEGKNRQVRKMTAAIGYPTLRLVRSAIENIQLHGMNPGEVLQFDKNKIYKLLRI